MWRVEEAFVCPVTRAPVRYRDRAALLPLLAEPDALDSAVEGAFVSDAAGLAYPVAEAIHCFLPAEALRLVEMRACSAPGPPTNEPVRRFYEDFGWQTDADGGYKDSNLYAGAAEAAARYEMLSHLSLIDHLGSGELLLDAGCGPLPHPEQLEYQRNFRHRVCVDFSRLALAEARRKLGDRGTYVLAELGALPFRDALFDGVVCGYTIMHVEEEKQPAVVEELMRVTAPGRHLLLISDNPEPNRRLQRGCRDLLRPFAGPRSGTKREQAERKAAQVAAPPLYFKPPRFAFWREQARRLGVRVRVNALRLFHVEEMERHFGDAPRAPERFRRFERMFPRLLARGSAYLLIDFVKPARTRSRNAAP